MSRHALSCLQNRRNFLRLIGERRQAFGEPEAQVTREGGAQENNYFPHFRCSYHIDQ